MAGEDGGTVSLHPPHWTCNDLSDRRSTLMAGNQLRRRLQRIENAATPLPVPAALPALPPADETGVLAAEIAAAFGRMVAYYREHYGLSPEEARRRVAEAPEGHLQRVLDCPPDQLLWQDLNDLAERDPARALRRWEEVVEAARQEIRTGHRAAGVLEGFADHCWDRARLLAVRAELAEAWRPRDAQEGQLVDQLAQWQTLLWRWQGTMTAYAVLAAQGVKRRQCDPSADGPPRQSVAEALEQAVRMVERMHGLYLRTLRALQDRRRVPAVLVRHARQVNLAHQQVNLAPGGSAAENPR
jgi:hypothetical protein